jgi:hypothetical protein
MAYDTTLAARVRKVLGRRPGIAEKEMFGGLAFLLGGRMFCGIIGSDLVVRIGPEDHDTALARPHVRPMDFTGRPARGFVFVGPGGCRTEQALQEWVGRGREYAASLPARKRRKK